ncbi:MAG: XisI protein [Saprospiraceae bacterium]
MANTKKYERIILQLLEEYAAIRSPFWPDVDNQIVADSQNHHYQLVRIGWDEKKNHVHYVVFHFDIIGAKVWVQANNTDRKIADELISMGIRRDDIVLGFSTSFASDLQLRAAAA